MNLKKCVKCGQWHAKKPIDAIHYPYIFCYLELGKKVANNKKLKLKLAKRYGKYHDYQKNFKAV